MRNCRKSSLRQSLRLAGLLEDVSSGNRYIQRRYTSAISTTAPSLVKTAFHNPGARQRLHDLQAIKKEVYPRFAPFRDSLSCESFNESYQGVQTKEMGRKGRVITLHGRVHAIRRAGSKLVFIDIIQDGHRVQGLCNLKNLEGSEMIRQNFRAFFGNLRKGDHLRLVGNPSRSDSGELSLSLTDLPELLSPCLADLPTKVEDPETRMRLRHLDLLVSRRMANSLRLKSEVIQFFRTYLLNAGYLEAHTPILAESAGGAIARPFETRATEFQERKLSMRIAPELWLKRLIVGGFDRVFEIGPSFRNEGIDSIHNPEFTTCEFYQAFANLDELISMTETMLGGLGNYLRKKAISHPTFDLAPTIDFTGPYKRIDFLNHLETAIGQPIPDLNGANAPELISKILHNCGIEVAPSTSLPQMLDRLSAHYIEPHCLEPTFIMHHPECLSPLAKSFKHPKNGQAVAARAELFVKGKEIVNTYEEENSPVEQRRKFEDQIRFTSGPEECAGVDESYLEALEWGLPPTGGWGGGVERLCMLMSDTNRIGDVLSFGNLRNVVALGHTTPPRH